MGKKNLFYETGTKIIYAISELMDEIPVNKITVTKVCERANLNRSTFYDHYRTLDEAISLVDKKLINEFNSIMASETEICDSLLLKIFTLIDNNKSFFKNFYSLGNSLLFCEYFKNLYEECKHDEGIEVAAYWGAGLNGIIKYWLFNDYNKNAKYMTEIFTKYLCNKNQ